MKGTARILIVENDEQNAKLAREILRFKGFETALAVSGEEGLRRARSEPFDLILMDIQLPGMDGLTTTRRLKASPATRRIPIIAVSALARQEDQERAYAAGCDGFVAKPYEIGDLLEAIHAALDSTAASTA